MNAEGGVGAKLVDEYRRQDLQAVIPWVEHPLPPRLYPKPLDQQAVRQGAAYAGEYLRAIDVDRRAG